MKQPKIQVKPTDRNNKQDKKMAKLMTEFINHEYESYEPIITQIARTRFFLEAVYGIKTADKPWEDLMGVVVKWVLDKEITK